MNSKLVREKNEVYTGAYPADAEIVLEIAQPFSVVHVTLCWPSQWAEKSVDRLYATEMMHLDWSWCLVFHSQVLDTKFRVNHGMI